MRIRTKHDNFTFLEKDGEVLLDNEPKVSASNDAAEKAESLMDTVTIQELIKNVEGIDFKDIEFLLDGVKMNEEMAEYGLNKKLVLVSDMELKSL